jgi:hypothetical protein
VQTFKAIDLRVVAIFGGMEQGRAQHQAKALRIASRSKRIDGVIHEPGVILLNFSDLERHFSSPLRVAAKDLGVCTTALKW